MFNRGKEKHRFFEKFISANPDLGGHFKNGSSASDEIINGEDKDAEELDTAEEEEGERSTMHLLGRRNLSSSINNHELVCELKEKGKLEEAISVLKKVQKTKRRQSLSRNQLRGDWRPVQRGTLQSHCCRVP